jgi:lipid A oxidase
VLAGLGIAIPHVEVTVDGDRTFEFQTTGLAGLAGAGLDVDITRWFSVFAEYRVSYAEIDANLVGGGTLKTEPWTHHFTLGVTFSILN